MSPKNMVWILLAVRLIPCLSTTHCSIKIRQK